MVGRGEELRCDKRAGLCFVLKSCGTVHALSLDVLAKLASGGENGYSTVPKFEIPRNYFLNHRGFYPPEVILGHGRVGV